MKVTVKTHKDRKHMKGIKTKRSKNENRKKLDKPKNTLSRLR